MPKKTQPIPSPNPPPGTYRVKCKTCGFIGVARGAAHTEVAMEEHFLWMAKSEGSEGPHTLALPPAE